MSSYGHAYLTSYGWSGTGTGLRRGAIAKPLAIPPKKNLSGLGKDRDEAFPFWDHLFTAASKAITIRISSDDEGADALDKDLLSPIDPLRRTTTGIISNRQPISGTPATDALNDTTDRLSLLATAKREAAKRGLYSRFFRGPILGPDDDAASNDALPDPEALSGEQEQDSIPVDTIENGKRKSRETKEERRERKRRKKERRAARAAKKAEKALAGEKAKDKRIRVDDTRPEALDTSFKNGERGAVTARLTSKKKRKRKDTSP